jgi:hypothetical protein
MRVEENWTLCPDCDSDRVVPASFRDTAPWDSPFARDGHRPDAEIPGFEVDAGEIMSNDEAWVGWALMRHYND